MLACTLHMHVIPSSIYLCGGKFLANSCRNSKIYILGCVMMTSFFIRVLKYCINTQHKACTAE